MKSKYILLNKAIEMSSQRIFHLSRFKFKIEIILCGLYFFSFLDKKLLNSLNTELFGGDNSNP